MRQDFRKNVISFCVSRERSHQSRCGATHRLSRRFNRDEAAIIFEKLRALDTSAGEGPRSEGRGKILTEQARFRQEGWYA